MMWYDWADYFGIDRDYFVDWVMAHPIDWIDSHLYFLKGLK